MNLQDVINNLPKISKLIKQVKLDIKNTNNNIFEIKQKIKLNEEKINKTIDAEINLKLMDKEIITNFNNILTQNIDLVKNQNIKLFTLLFLKITKF